MAEKHEHATADAFEKAVKKAMAKFKVSYVGAPQEKTHFHDAKKVVEDLNAAIAEIWPGK